MAEPTDKSVLGEAVPTRIDVWTPPSPPGAPPDSRPGAIVPLPAGMTPADIVRAIPEGLTDAQLRDMAWRQQVAMERQRSMAQQAGIAGAFGGGLGQGLTQASVSAGQWDNNALFSIANISSAIPTGQTFGVAGIAYQFSIPDGGRAVVTLDDRRRPHSFNGQPAVTYYEHHGAIIKGEEYAWHGVRVPAFVITKPDYLTPDVIEAEQNAEVRRVMIEIYGAQRYMHDCGAMLMHRDECGELYRKKPTFEGEEDLWFVKVKNATPEPDGTFKDYFLRVPPSTTRNERGIWGGAVRTAPFKTAREAVAWTFNIDPAKYKPLVQS